KLRKALPDFALTSDVIVGFPGETEEEYQETYDFIRDLGFAELHVFPYSQRTGTPAARMPDQVPDEIKHQRVTKLISLSAQLAKTYASRYENEVLEVIPEEPFNKDAGTGQWVGYTDNYLKVRFNATPEMEGKLVKVKLTKAGYPYNQGEFVRILDNAAQIEKKAVSL
ncbi:MAG TPA: tRNA (N(6)-L-threonylcarbamoyladenosine(37)-C(2))-methylthiotransferase MtaB, partial [Candidatus Angelobacter sp.]|nr:tRNA (N(6)-L-threonylcarbamoyladenosine(37)-C(2))-methylthiotransferase MtaB [Candidatus Angelobacter sp.]